MISKIIQVRNASDLKDLDHEGGIENVSVVCYSYGSRSCGPPESARHGHSRHRALANDKATAQGGGAFVGPVA